MSSSLGVAKVRVGPWGKLPWFPFEALISVLLILSGISDLFFPNEPVVSPVEPTWFVTTVGILYLLSGISMFFGLWRMQLRLEMFGLMTLIMVIGVTTIGTLAFNGPDWGIQSIIFLTVIWASATRLYELLKGRRTVQIEPMKEEE